MTINTREINEIRFLTLCDAVGEAAGVSATRDDFGQPMWRVVSKTDGTGSYIATFAPAYDVEGGDDEEGDLGWDLNITWRDNQREEFDDIYQGDFADVATLLAKVAEFIHD